MLVLEGFPEKAVHSDVAKFVVVIEFVDATFPVSMPQTT